MTQPVESRLNRRRLLTGLIGLPLLPVSARAAAAWQAGAPPSLAARPKLEPRRYTLERGLLRIDVVDLTPRFLDFYSAAAREPDPGERFKIWQARYGFAAVPPGPAGEAIARGLLDRSWSRYAASLSGLRAGARGMRPDPMSLLEGAAKVLGADLPVRVRLNAYVGSFEDNAFTVRTPEAVTVSAPLESPAERRRLLLAHELAHAVHITVADLAGGWERTIGSTLLQEGLAMHAAREIAPGARPEAYLEHEAGWLRQARAREAAILAGVRPHLQAKDGATVTRFTFGTGPAGLPREAYYAGWVAVTRLRQRGMGLAQIAKVKEIDLPALAASAIT